MIHINNLANINKIKENNFYVVTDFDQTITTHNSNTTFSLFAKSGLYPNQYLIDRTKLYNYYRPLELNPHLSYDEKVKLSKEWHMASYKLMLKYQLKESDIDKIIENEKLISLRRDSISFIYYLNDNKIPLIICSAGINNFIEKILQKYNCYSDNIFIHSNTLTFKNNIIYDNNDQAIHSMVKNHIKLSPSFLNKIKNKDCAVVIGDQLHDINMAKYLPKKDVISFGFLESNIEENKNLFMDNYDVVLTGYDSFKPIQKILDKKG